jgi:hypothetical protein
MSIIFPGGGYCVCALVWENIGSHKPARNINSDEVLILIRTFGSILHLTDEQGREKEPDWPMTIGAFGLVESARAQTQARNIFAAFVAARKRILISCCRNPVLAGIFNRANRNGRRRSFSAMHPTILRQSRARQRLAVVPRHPFRGTRGYFLRAWQLGLSHNACERTPA